VGATRVTFRQQIARASGARRIVGLQQRRRPLRLDVGAGRVELGELFVRVRGLSPLALALVQLGKRGQQRRVSVGRFLERCDGALGMAERGLGTRQENVRLGRIRLVLEDPVQQIGGLLVLARVHVQARQRQVEADVLVGAIGAMCLLEVLDRLADGVVDVRGALRIAVVARRPSSRRRCRGCDAR
jgi:hypothetical protein